MPMRFDTAFEATNQMGKETSWGFKNMGVAAVARQTPPLPKGNRLSKIRNWPLGAEGMRAPADKARRHATTRLVP